MELCAHGDTRSSLRTTVSSAVLFVLILLSSSSLSLRPSSGFLSSLQSDTLCDLAHCWELYNSAQESLRIHDDYPPTRLRALQVEDIAVRCVAFRTFFLCLRNMSRTCLGDLNFHSAHKGVEKQMKAHNCTVTGRVFEPAVSETWTHLPVCSFAGSRRSTYRHCSVFGDPHVRTFAGDFDTCDLQGAWPMIDNEFFTVQVTSERVGNSEGTAVTKVTVLIKHHDECALDRYVTYQATSNDLPSTFDDGQTSFGRSDSVTIQEVKPNSHIEIYIRYIDTTVVVRLHGRYFTVSLKMPDELVGDDAAAQHGTNLLQLCLKSCPLRERIDVQKFISLSSQKRPYRTDTITADGALSLCRAYGLVDYYLDSCVFDLMTTGDSNFTLLSLHAYTDIVLLLPESAAKFDNRTTLYSNCGRKIFVFEFLVPLVVSILFAIEISL